MSGGSLLMLVIGIIAIVAGGVVLARPPRTEAAVYARRMGGIMLMAFGLVLVIAAISLRNAIGMTLA